VTFPGLPAGPSFPARIGKFGHALTEFEVTVGAGGTTVVPVELVRGFHDDFRADQAWTMGEVGDDATDGLWVRGVPTGSYFLGVVEPEVDATPTADGFCLVTEPHDQQGFVGNSDVDGGRTTVLSPVFDGLGLGDLTLTYQRWFSNRAPTPGSDEFRADVSSDGGVTWTNLETLDVGVEAWSLVSVDLGSVVDLSSTMRLRFVAEDLGENQYVEAAVDDVQILTGATAVAAGPSGETGLALGSPRPNPFRAGGTRIEFRVPAAGPVTLEVFDVTGRKVATLLRAERLGAGIHRAEWDGGSDDGRAATPGVYFARLAAGAETRTTKITRLR
jgi:hypothetical protein